MDFTPEQIAALGVAFEAGFVLVAKIGVVSWSIGVLLNLISRG